MSFTIVAASLLALQATPETTTEETKQDPAEAVQPANAEDKIDVVDEKPVKPKKITDKSHPDYVRCKSEAVIGSRARRKRTCMTNREWALVARRGNEAARDFVGTNQPGFLSESN